VRWIVAVSIFSFAGCGPGVVFNNSQEMTADQMLARADHVFIGVIGGHHIENWPFFRVRGEPDYWRLVRMRVRVENVLRGIEPRKEVDIYEIFWTGATSGDWNLTQNDQRYLFLVRVENGHYHVVRDWWRSIFPVKSGFHEELPLDDSRPFWERVALLQWWIQPGWSEGIGTEIHKDPAWALSLWRVAKIERGLLRHPDPRLRRIACENLLMLGRSQDECFSDIPPKERTQRGVVWNGLIPQNEWEAHRAWEQGFGQSEWGALMSPRRLTSIELDEARLFTTVNNRALRTRFCREFERRFPGDHDNGCPADRPPPATIVTKDGDVPLNVPWPVEK
jgi:hypothetical protein